MPSRRSVSGPLHLWGSRVRCDHLRYSGRGRRIPTGYRFNRAYRKHIRQFVRTLQEGNNEFLGIVLNGLSPRRIEYYTNYRYYRSYKKYYGSQS